MHYEGTCFIQAAMLKIHSISDSQLKGMLLRACFVLSLCVSRSLPGLCGLNAWCHSEALASQHHTVTGSTSVPGLWLAPSAATKMPLNPEVSGEIRARPRPPGPQADLLPIWQFLTL